MTINQLFMKYLKGLRLRMASLFVVVISYVSLTLISPLLFAFLSDNVINGAAIDASWLVWYRIFLVVWIPFVIICGWLL